MPRNESGIWFPDLFERQLEVFSCYRRAVLASGPRLGGKSHATQHKVLRHLWEIDGARVAMFSRTLKLSKDGGPWSQLQRDVVPEWVKANMGFRYTTFKSDGTPGPKVDGQTRTPYFRVRNMHGGESECLLFSLDNDQQTEEKLKEMTFSMIYFSELSKFQTPELLSVALPLLRMKGVPFEMQQFVADTNPSEDGEDSWIWKTWYRDRTASYDEYCKNRAEEGLPIIPRELFHEFQDSLALFEFPMRENPHLDPRQINEVVVACAGDVGMYERLVNGKWIYGVGDVSRHFRGKFRKSIHVLGNCEDKSPEDWICALPSPGCYELITGWDLGDVNHAAAAIDRTIVNGESCFTILDELVSIGEEVSIENFTEGFMEIIEGIERDAGKKLDLTRAWSDRSSLEKYNATADTFPHLRVLAASDERIRLEGVPKAKGSVRFRVDLLKRLLAGTRQNPTGRFRVSAHCKHTIQMLENLKKGKSALTYVVEDEHKHIFDAITYALLMECAEELSSGKAAGRREHLVVSI